MSRIRDVAVKRGCMKSDLTLARRSERIAAVLAVPCFASAGAGRIDRVSLSCTGLAEEVTGSARRLAQQQEDLYTVLEAGGLAVAGSKTKRLAACSNLLAEG